MEGCHGMMLWMHSDRSKRICVPPLLFCLVHLNWPLGITISDTVFWYLSLPPIILPPSLSCLSYFFRWIWLCPLMPRDFLDLYLGGYSRRCLGTICRYTNWTKGAHMQSKCLNPWPHWPLFWSSEISYYADLPIRQATSLFALSFLLSMGR